MEFDELNKEETIGLGIMVSIGLVIAYFVPGWMAQMAGWEQSHDQLVAWAGAKDLWLLIPLLFVYVLSGFLVLVAALCTGFTIAYVLFLGVKEATIWTAKAATFLVAAILTFLGKFLVFVFKVIIWPFRVVAEFVQSLAISSTAHIRQAWAERLELRRLYREEFADQFSSFREFKRRLNDPQTEDKQDEPRQKKPPKTDPYTTAIRLLGLTGNFTRKELEARYRRLMRGVHPDVAGPNELAAQINQARDLIKRRKGWK